MKQRSTILLLALTVTLVLTAFFVGKASASTGCFTDTVGHWAETFICFLKDNGITSGTAPGIYSPEANVTRAQMAVFMQKLDELAVAQAKTYTDTSLSGPVYISAGYNGWVPSAGSTGTIGYFSDWNELRGPAAGSYTFLLTPDLPFTLYGKQLSISGVKICYRSVSATQYITSISLLHRSESLALTNSVTDDTDRTVPGCTIINLPVASALLGGDHVVLSLQSTLGVAGVVGIVSTTFILNSSATIGTLKEPADNPGMDATDTSGGSHQVP